MNSNYSRSTRKIAPASGFGLQTRLETFDTPEIGPTRKAMEELLGLGLSLPHLHKMREYRLGRITDELSRRDLGAILLFDPINIRYATDSMNMQVWTMHNLARATLVTADGYVVLWDFTHCEHMTKHLPLIDEVRSGAGAFYFEHGDKEPAMGVGFIAEVKSILAEKGIADRIAVDRMDVSVAKAFDALQLPYVAGQPVMEHARVIKGEEEIKAMRCTAAACEIAVGKMHEALMPGLAEVELWAVLHAENIARGGEWIETRILNSGPRTNPWMQEAGPRVLKEGELLAFDTDLVGLYGYCCDMSRTWLIGDFEPSLEQKECYQVAYDHIQENTALLKPGVAFKDLTFTGHELPKAFQAQKYCVKMHGVGMCDEFPSIYYPDHYIEGAFDYELEPGMVLCVEAYTGKVGGSDGVKLEDQVLVTPTGYEVLTTYPFENRLLKS